MLNHSAVVVASAVAETNALIFETDCLQFFGFFAHIVAVVQPSGHVTPFERVHDTYRDSRKRHKAFVSDRIFGHAFVLQIFTDHILKPKKFALPLYSCVNVCVCV